ncbi:hypothetical protein BDY24DRAFT_396339 [Mrakia frigida]|uniref:uncharacterized protein n=1 Tax=Mrakia frigida TaxID=29902 RepID=UPI003FCC14DF
MNSLLPLPHISQLELEDSTLPRPEQGRWSERNGKEGSEGWEELTLPLTTRHRLSSFPLPFVASSAECQKQSYRAGGKQFPLSSRTYELSSKADNPKPQPRAHELKLSPTQLLYHNHPFFFSTTFSTSCFPTPSSLFPSSTTSSPRLSASFPPATT